tara:strand:+ start:318153 stop:318515 length:363 start_codon:yes stop_codon:yes gene_type:complete
MHPAHAHLYVHVHVVFWPWLWLQLWNLNRWMKESGQGLLISVDRCGTIYVNAISDALEQGPRSISVPVSPRLAAALAPEIQETTYPRRKPGSHAILSPRALAGDPGLRREYGDLGPIPDT